MLERIEADETAAEEFRERHRREPTSPLEPDAAIAHHLRPHESLLAVHPHALITIEGGYGTGATTGGRLYVTSERMVHLGSTVHTVDLRDLEELALSGERLLLMLTAGEGVVIEVPRPRLLRAQAAAAMVALRARKSAT